MKSEGGGQETRSCCEITVADKGGYCMLPTVHCEGFEVIATVCVLSICINSVEVTQGFSKLKMILDKQIDCEQSFSFPNLSVARDATIERREARAREEGERKSFPSLSPISPRFNT